MWGSEAKYAFFLRRESPMVLEGEAERHAGKPYSLEPGRVKRDGFWKEAGAAGETVSRTWKFLGVGGSKESPSLPNVPTLFTHTHSSDGAGV